jgi:hypothetical protein
MAEGEVIQEIKAEGAQEAASSAVLAVVETAGAVNANVEEVKAELADHQEASEERHIEILEGEAWLRKSLEVLSTTLTENLLALRQSLQLQAEQITALKIEVANLSTFLATKPLTPETPPKTPEVPIVEAEKPKEEEENPAAKTGSAKRYRKV